MKLLTRKRVQATVEPVKESKETEVQRKSHKNKLPPDEYKDLIPPVDIPLNDKGKLVVSVKRGGELGLPKVDIRYYAMTETYEGFTQKGINFFLPKLNDLASTLFEVSEICEKLKLFDEFETEEDENSDEE